MNTLYFVQDEIDRESQSDVFTILISYIFMFAYVAFALGQYQVSAQSVNATFPPRSSVCFYFGLTGHFILPSVSETRLQQVTGNNLATLLVHSKIMLGAAGVLIVALSVTSSIGLYAFYGIPATTIVLEVQPFLVLAVGVDNIFIFVQAYQVGTTQIHHPPA